VKSESAHDGTRAMLQNPGMSDAAVRHSFIEQAGWCRKLGSPFTALLCETLAASLDAGTAIGREILDWPGDPRATADALALRVAGALHALARGHLEPALTALYPPAPLPDAASLWRAARAALERQPQHFREYLAVAPQTNEVGRSGVLIAGLLQFARHHAVPLHLFEIGASAGLNLYLDRYRYRFGDASWGDPRAALELAPEWRGDPPAVDVGLRVASRQGCDLAPIDIASPAERARLLSYVWADQTERLQRVATAIGTALAEPTHIEARDAAEWLEEKLPPVDAARAGARVLFHSVFWNYLPASTQRRIETQIALCAAAATAAQPFGWLRLELDPADGQAALQLSDWPGARTQLLARAHPHGRSVTWLP
jgi:hypothetical protein